MDKLFAFDINETITEGDSYHKTNKSPIELTDPAQKAFQKLNTQNQKIVFYSFGQDFPEIEEILKKTYPNSSLIVPKDNKYFILIENLNGNKENIKAYDKYQNLNPTEPTKFVSFID